MLVDHVEPHEGDKQRFWCEAMWQSSCTFHHNVVKQRLEAMQKQGRITVADLWLDSQPAQVLTRTLMPNAA